MSFNLKDPKLLTITWFLTIQFYFVQIYVALSWQGIYVYSWLNNTISDLGATSCGYYNGRLICSPRHETMNISFMLLGVLQALGASLLIKHFSNKLVKFGTYGFYLAAIGIFIVGAFPENHSGHWHIVGAAMSLAIGNISLMLYGYGLNIRTYFRAITFLLGLIGFVSTLLFASHLSLGIGGGLLERFAAYPQSLWMAMFSLFFYSLNNKPQLPKP